MTPGGTGAGRVRATGVGSWPGEDDAAHTEAQRRVLDELDLPHLVEVPGRGPQAGMAGRAMALLVDLGADLQPAGWRLTDRPGVDQRRARSLLRRDLDVLEELGQGYAGPLKVQVAGPWTLAATVERPRGDRLLADHGARRELAQSLAEGVAGHVADVRRRLPGVTELFVQVDEPALPGVLAGSVPTASGFGKHRAVDRARARTALGELFAAAGDTGAVPLAHCCAPEAPVGLLREAGARGLSVDLGVLAPSAHDELAAAYEAGEPVVAGVVPSDGSEPDAGRAAEEALRWLEMVGLAPGPSLVVAPACGLAGVSPGVARRATAAAIRAASQLT